MCGRNVFYYQMFLSTGSVLLLHSLAKLLVEMEIAILIGDRFNYSLLVPFKAHCKDDINKRYIVAIPDVD